MQIIAESSQLKNNNERLPYNVTNGFSESIEIGKVSENLLKSFTKLAVKFQLAITMLNRDTTMTSIVVEFKNLNAFENLPMFLLPYFG